MLKTFGTSAVCRSSREEAVTRSLLTASQRNSALMLGLCDILVTDKSLYRVYNLKRNPTTITYDGTKLNEKQVHPV
jgi:hypothetical protein